MNNWFFDIFNYYMIFYSAALALCYLAMAITAFFSIRNRKRTYSINYIKRMLKESPHTPGVSIVAPAYNEEKTVVDNVNSMLSLDYPKFEIVIVNDGSKDKTLEILIENFELVEVPYNYVEQIKTKPYKRLFKSTNPKYDKLVVVDKTNGGTKADASNAGVNVAKYPYFVCTDVDCILAQDGLYHLIWDVLTSKKRVIAVSATMRMANGCEISEGRLTNIRPPLSPIPLFQELEYMRSFLVGKTWWAAIGGMPNVSGGFGLFDKDIAIKVGGYHADSMAEDMDMIARMSAYMYNTKTPFCITQVPATCCWTEGPGTLKILNRQRTRWGRGLFQVYNLYFDLLFKRRYGVYGMFTLPYILIFEFMGPILEALGLIVILILILTNSLNWSTFWLLMFTVYTFSQLVNVLTIVNDNLAGCTYTKKRSYLLLIVASLFESILYHPLTVLFSLKGYISFLTSKDFKWGEMTRQGVKKKKGQTPTPQEAGGTTEANKA